MDPKSFPAFPCTDSANPDDYPGMTLRDYFAAKAMHQFLQGAVFPVGCEAAPTLRSIAELAYQAADAMLAARG